MKTKFATLIALFFLILSSQAEEQDVVHRYTAGADSFYRRTLSRIAEGAKQGVCDVKNSDW